jgi:hypothetical protein
MGHQYVWEGQATPLEYKYGEFIAQVKDRNERMQLVNQIIGDKTDPTKHKESEVFQHFIPNSKFIDAYNEREIKNISKQAKEEYFKTYNEAGKAYANVCNQEEFKKIHDPLSK